MEFLESFKSNYEKYYKRTEIATTSRDTIDAALNANRRLTRANLLSQRRNIDESIVLTPAPKKKTKADQKKKEKTPVKTMDRLAMLKIWKLEKEKKKKEERNKRKPIFHLGAPKNVGFPTDIPSFAPANYKFKIPANIKPINMKLPNPIIQRVTRSQKPIASPPLPLPNKRKKRAVSNKTALSTINNKPKKALVRQNAFDQSTSQKSRQNIENVDPLEERTVKKPQTNSNKKRRSSKRKSMQSCENTEIEATACTSTSTKRRSTRKSSKKTSSEESDLNSTHELIDCSVPIEKVDTMPSLNTTKTPENKLNTSIYISPFVTTSRGKGSMRKENNERSIRGLPSFTEYQTPDKEKNSAFQISGAAYFHTVLNNQISKLEELCKIWQAYKNSNKLTEDVEDTINVAVGQANLLMNKKFQQFKGLILSCETGQGQEKPVTCEDLQGFWDMIYMQVENLTVRFNRLATLKENNWKEIAPVVASNVQKKRINPKKPIVKSSSSTSTGLKAAIEAARKKKQSKIVPAVNIPNEEKSEEIVFNGGFFVVRSPHKTAVKTPRKTRASLRISVLSAAKSVGNSSVSLSMTKASQIAKSVENLSSVTLPTPGKSILKKAKTVTTSTPRSRVVLFKDGDASE